MPSTSSTGSPTDARPLPLRVVLTYVGEPGQPQFWANFSDWNTSPRLPETTFQFTPPAGARQIAFAAQVSESAGAPAIGRAERGGQAMSSRKCANPYVACLAAMATLVLLPIGDAFAARPQRGASGGEVFKGGPRGQREHVAAGQRPIRRSRCPVIGRQHSGRHRSRLGSSAERQGSRDENQGQRQASHDENQSQRQDNADDVREDREDYYEDRYDDWDGYDDDDHELAAGLVVGAVVGAAAASADNETTTTTTTTTTAATTSASLPCNPSVSTVEGVTYYKCGQQHYVQAYGGSGPIYMPTQPPK